MFLRASYSPMEENACTKEPIDATVPSCESCRKRKLKCARQQPQCSHCDRLGIACIYEFERKKPGFKVGAVESLNRRLEVVEKTLSDRQQEESQTTSDPVDRPKSDQDIDPSHEVSAPLVGVLSSLINELHSLNRAIGSVKDHASTLETPLTNPRPGKRQRTEYNSRVSEHTDKSYTTSPKAPAKLREEELELEVDYDHDLLQSIVDAYFRYIHPWISIVHEPSLRDDIRLTDGRKSPVIIHAMSVAALKNVLMEGQPLNREFILKKVHISRRFVLNEVMESVCPEALQALLILIFSYITDGTLTKASSLLGIAWRHIETLNLHLTDPVTPICSGIFKRHTALPISADWMRREEWRRIFWNAFMLDRLCAALLGQKPTALRATSTPRLPACGSLWYTNQSLPTPHIRISDPAQCGLGQLLSESFPSDSQRAVDPPIAPSNQNSNISGVGALAFYVETMESLSLVISHFLSVEVDYKSSSEVARWLTRFQQLDQHLFRWKVRLPQQWADSGVSRRILSGVMDPAMTAANATHNTSLILLHEKIAYPDRGLEWVQIPSTSSADTCENAAIEICTIIGKILGQRGVNYPLSPQLGLCAFVSARTLLLHWRSFRKPLADEFWLLVHYLDDMAQRWRAIPPPISIFAIFANRLRDFHNKCTLNSSYAIDKDAPLFDIPQAQNQTSKRHWIEPHMMNIFIERNRAEFGVTAPLEYGRMLHTKDLNLQPQDEIATLDSNLDQHQQQEGNHQANPQWKLAENREQSGPILNDDNLLAISESLLDENFTGLDRIVTLDDMMMGSFPENALNWDFNQG